MRGGKVKHDAFIRMLQKLTALFAGLHRRERASATLGDHAASQLVPVRVEVVEDQVDSSCTSVLAADVIYEICEDCSRTVWSQVAVYLSGGHLHAGR